MTHSLKDIENAIKELESQKDELIRVDEESKIARFKMYDWIQHTKASIYYRDIRPYGDDKKYTVWLNITDLPDFKKPFWFPLYKSVYFYSHDMDWNRNVKLSPHLQGDNIDDLVEFLGKYPFKEISFNKEEAKLLHFLYNRYEA